MPDHEHLLPLRQHPLLHGLRFEVGASNHSRVWTGHQTGRRSLPDWCIVVARGLRLRVETDSTTELAEGSVLAIPPFTQHNIRVLAGPGTSTWLHCRWLTAEGDDLLAATAQPLAVHGAEAAAIAAAIDALVRRLSAEGSSARALAEMQIAAWRLAAAFLDRSGPAQEPLLRLLTDRRLAPVTAFVRQHLAQRLTCAGLARVAGLKPSQFHQIFRDELGQSPAAWVRRERIAKAQRLLRTSDLPLAEVAAQTGPWDLSTFHRAFAALVGTSPSSWRRNQSAAGMG